MSDFLLATGIGARCPRRLFISRLCVPHFGNAIHSKSPTEHKSLPSRQEAVSANRPVSGGARRWCAGARRQGEASKCGIANTFAGQYEYEPPWHALEETTICCHGGGQQQIHVRMEENNAAAHDAHDARRSRKRLRTLASANDPFCWRKSSRVSNRLLTGAALCLFLPPPPRCNHRRPQGAFRARAQRPTNWMQQRQLPKYPPPPPP